MTNIEDIHPEFGPDVIAMVEGQTFESITLLLASLEEV